MPDKPIGVQGQRILGVLGELGVLGVLRVLRVLGALGKQKIPRNLCNAISFLLSQNSQYSQNSQCS